MCRELASLDMDAGLDLTSAKINAVSIFRKHKGYYNIWSLQ